MGNRRTASIQYETLEQSLSFATQRVAGLEVQYSSHTISTESTNALPDIAHHLEALQAEVRRIGSVIPNPMMRAGFSLSVTGALQNSFEGHMLQADGGQSSAGSRMNSMIDKRHQRKVHQRHQRAYRTYRNATEIKTIFGVVSIVRETRKIISDEESPPDESRFEHKSSFRVHPASWLIWLGVSYGLELREQNSTHGWRQTMETYRAVPDDADIFSYCLYGNLDGVRKLLTDGAASIWDTDSGGWTPLAVNRNTGHEHDERLRSYSTLFWRGRLRYVENCSRQELLQAYIIPPSPAREIGWERCKSKVSRYQFP